MDRSDYRREIEALAREARRVALRIDDPAMRRRLFEIANETAPLLAVDHDSVVAKQQTGYVACMHQPHVPLCHCAPEKLRARADELRRRAAAARTADVMQSLLRLAERFEACAEQRAD